MTAPPFTPSVESRLRAMSGDTGTGSEQDVSPEDMAAYWQETGGRFAATMVLVLEHRLGKRINDVTDSGELGERNADIFNRINNDLLPYWTEKAELEAADIAKTEQGRLRIGSFNIGIDSREEDLP